MDNSRTIILFFTGSLLLGIAIGVGLGFALWGIRPAERYAPTPYWSDEPWLDHEERPGEPPFPEETQPDDPLVHLHEELAIWPARHLVVSVEGTSLNRATRALLNDLKPGAVLLLPDNISNRTQTEQLVRQIKDAVGLGTDLADLPLIAVAQEGGIMNPLDLDDAIGAHNLASSGDTEQAREVGRRYGEACARRGIAILLAPVLDIAGTEEAALPMERTFGNGPETVAELALAFAEGVMEAGVLPVGKYFPGLGASKEDPELGLAMLLRERSALEPVLQPFKEAVARELPGILAGHIAAPALDQDQPTRPASLSPVALHGLLREQWGYEGVILSDNVTARAVSSSRTPETAAVEAIQAGADAVIYLERTPLSLRVVCKSIELAVEDGRVPRERLFESMQRLEAWQTWLRNPRLPGEEESADEEPSSDDATREEPMLQTHAVQPGEHLSGIAARYGITVAELRSLNNLSGDVIHVGQSLQIPANAE